MSRALPEPYAGYFKDGRFPAGGGRLFPGGASLPAALAVALVIAVPCCLFLPLIVFGIRALLLPLTIRKEIAARARGETHFGVWVDDRVVAARLIGLRGGVRTFCIARTDLVGAGLVRLQGMHGPSAFDIEVTFRDGQRERRTRLGSHLYLQQEAARTLVAALSPGV